jgi:hypothetical protein
LLLLIQDQEIESLLFQMPATGQSCLPCAYYDNIEWVIYYVHVCAPIHILRQKNQRDPLGQHNKAMLLV